MINELDVIDWSSMTHAYGPADEVPVWLKAMASTDAAVREDALSRFYSAVHHQGDVYASTTASLPFLFALADDPVTPDRASIVELLVSIGSHAVERCENVYADGPDHNDGPDYAGSAVVVRERADSFAAYASDADPLVRRAAVEGLGLFIDDAGRAAALLRDRMSAEDGVRERLPVVEAMATLALRLPDAKDTAKAWFGVLAGDTQNDPAVRLAADYEWTRVHAATALWDIGGPDESALVVRTLLDAWQENGATANHAMACLDRMGTAAASAAPFVRAQLALARRGGRFHGVGKDEELRRVGHAFLVRLG